MNSKTTQSSSMKADASTKQSTTGDAKADATKPSRLAQLQTLLTAPNGATIAEMTTVTGWQAHSVRGAMAGALKKRGLTISSQKTDGIRRYQASAPA